MLISIGVARHRAGSNFGLDFTGGTLVEVKFVDPVVAEDVRISLAKAGLHEAVAQHFGSERDVLVRVPPQKGESEALLADHLRGALDTQLPGRGNATFRIRWAGGRRRAARDRWARGARSAGRRHGLHDVSFHEQIRHRRGGGVDSRRRRHGGRVLGVPVDVRSADARRGARGHRLFGERHGRGRRPDPRKFPQAAQRQRHSKSSTCR